MPKKKSIVNRGALRAARDYARAEKALPPLPNPVIGAKVKCRTSTLWYSAKSGEITEIISQHGQKMVRLRMRSAMSGFYHHAWVPFADTIPQLRGAAPHPIDNGGEWNIMRNPFPSPDAAFGGSDIPGITNDPKSQRRLLR